ncbi:hypothetical protein XENOCAPTIV_014918 [Xenoophorus captivus]|uniref:Uncharacterized protein n=1 Tax=Xenoophorus captivus TaxID=1517983 RepID=A0ABV0R8R3_9TELE
MSKSQTVINYILSLNTYKIILSVSFNSFSPGYCSQMFIFILKHFTNYISAIITCLELFTNSSAGPAGPVEQNKSNCSFKQSDFEMVTPRPSVMTQYQCQN